jgi:SNF family Na+-dependent transporter
MYIAGITSAFSYAEGIVTNMMERPKSSMCGGKVYRPLEALFVCMIGMCGSVMFCTNWGWPIMDMVDHYLSDYIILGVGLLQCISVGWFFEYDTTAAMSEGHQKALRTQSVWYWVPVVICCFYGNYAEVEMKWIFVVVIVVLIIIGWIISKCKSGLSMNVWYHEIMLCGVDKLSMSITDLTD